MVLMPARAGPSAKLQDANGGRRILSLTVAVAAASSFLGSKSAGAGLRKPPPSFASLPVCSPPAPQQLSAARPTQRGCCAGSRSSVLLAPCQPGTSSWPTLAGRRPLNPAACLPVLKASPARRSLQVAPGLGPQSQKGARKKQLYIYIYLFIYLYLSIFIFIYIYIVGHACLETSWATSYKETVRH